MTSLTTSFFFSPKISIIFIYALNIEIKNINIISNIKTLQKKVNFCHDIFFANLSLPFFFDIYFFKWFLLVSSYMNLAVLGQN